jgi:hypothetical protein
LNAWGILPTLAIKLTNRPTAIAFASRLSEDTFAAVGVCSVRAYSIVLAVGLAACATKPPPVWLRTDGTSAAGDPVLAQQFEIDRTVCLGERERADLSGVTVAQGGLIGMAAAQNRANAADAVAQGCMAQKGYILVPAEMAAAKSQELAAIAAEKVRREAVATTPLPTPAKPTGAKPKPKPPQSQASTPPTQVGISSPPASQ